MVRRRTLRPDERDLWHAVARTAQPLHPGRLWPADAPTGPAADRPKPAEPALPAFRIGEKLSASRDQLAVPALLGRPSADPLRMDAKTFARMSRGRMQPEARIDLHGMTLAEAHPELVAFVLSARARGLRLVLVITGKGRGSRGDGPLPLRPGILRDQTPRWLAAPPLTGAVQQVAQAHPKHGGAGAFYVYLRRD